MASADQTQLRAKFLQEAAYILAVPSPTTAAFLGNARNKLIEDAEVDTSSKESDAYRRSVCGACGNVMIPGWSCKVSNKGNQRSIGNKSSEPEKSICYTCLRCQRETHQTLPRERRRRKLTERLQPPVDTVPISEATTTTNKEENVAAKTINASSKQRQKARRGGLQAMLDKKKTQDSGAGGLNFMDFAL